MRYPFVIASLAVLVAFPATGQIYRCEVDGVAAFSDLPCGADSVPYRSEDKVSFVTPDENLPALAEAARAYILERRERLARRASPERQATAPSASLPARSHTVYVPWPVIGHARNERRFEGRPTEPPPSIGDNARYSPLAGPILGTRRDSWLFDQQLPSDRAQRRQ